MENNLKKVKELRRWTEKHEIDIVLLQELNTNMQHTKVKNYFTQLKNNVPGMEIIYSQTPYDTTTTYKPGGTAILLSNNMARFISKRIKDPIGRWTAIQLRMKYKRFITIISTYQPPDKQNIKGTINITAQQQRWHLERNHASKETPNIISSKTLKTHFRNDFNNLLHKMTQESQEVIICGDFNEHHDINNIIADIIDKHNMHNILLKFDLHNLPTYKHSKYSVDRAFCSTRILENTQDAQLLQYEDIISTDHRPIIFKVDISSEQTPTDHNPRRLKSNNSRNVTDYIRKKYRLMKQHKIFDTIHNLKSHEITEEALNQIDKRLTEISLQVERSLPQNREDGWNTLIPINKQKLNQINKDLKQLIKMDTPQKSEITKKKKEKQKIIQFFKAQTQEGYKIRHQEIRDKIQTLYQEDPVNKSKISRLKQILQTELTRLAYQAIKRQTQMAPRTFMNKIQVETSEGNIQEYQDVDDIAKQVVKYNTTHFHQAHKTPLANYEFNPKTIKELKEHDYIDSNSLMHTLLSRIEKKPTKMIPEIIDEADWRAKIRKWPERTTTSPSGLHLGHYKSTIADHNWTHDDNSENKAEFDSHQEEILGVHLQLVNLAIQNGFALERWKTVHSILLFKDKTNSLLHRTRNIHIFEADYNLMLKIKWGQAMHQAEETNTLHTAQYGCRKGRTAHEPVFIETMQHEITRFTRQTYNQVNFDAQACFDRIIPNLAIRLSYKYGIPSTVLQTYQTTLKETKYFIKIGHHITKEFYKSTEENVLFGTGQGSGNSPILWILLSNELIDMYTEKTTGATYQDPSGKTKTSIHMTAYVDDINTHKTYPHYTPKPEMHDNIQQDISIWEKILYTSGGLISNTKCTYYTNKWEFSTTSHPNTTNEDYNDIVLHSKAGRFNIQSLPTKQQHKTLGYHQSIGASITHQTHQVEEKVQKNIAVVREASLSYSDMNKYYTSIFIPKISYNTTITSIPKLRAEKITTKMVPILLRKKGYSGSTPTAIALGSKQWGGLGLFNLYPTQGAKNLLQMARALQKNDQQSTLVKIAYKWWRYQVGTEKCPLAQHEIKTNYTDSVWFSEVHNYVKTFNIEVKIPDDGVRLLRKHDQHLMDTAQSLNYPPKTLRLINYCRLYLNASTIADITNIKGTHVEIGCYNFTEAKPINTNWATIATYPKPNKFAWHHWKVLIDQLTLHNTRRLKQPLKEWITYNPNIRKQYKHYITDGVLYTRNKEGFQYTTQDKLNKGDVDHLPTTAAPAELTPFGTIITEQIRITEDTQIQVNLHVPNIPQKIIMVSDASVQKGIAAWAWVVADEEGNIIKSHSHRIREIQISSFRAEAFGALSAMEMIHYHRSHIKQWTFYCDNQALITRLKTIQHQEVPFQWHDSDILGTIKNKLTPNGTFHHVKGHQDIISENWDKIEVRLNILADQMAKEAIKGPIYNTQIDTPIRIQAHNKNIFNFQDLNEHNASTIIQTYWKQKLGTPIYDTINWDLYQRIIDKNKKSMAIIKMVNSLTPTQCRLNTIDKNTCPLCPLCKLEQETIHHVYYCKMNNESLNTRMLDLQNKLKERKVKIKHAQQLIDILAIGKPPAELSILTTQCQIGWKRILQGKCAKDIHTILSKILTSEIKEKDVHILIISLIEQWKSAWQYRNKATQYLKQQDILQQSEDHLEMKLRYLYTNREYLDIAQQKFLLPSYEIHMKQQLTQKKNWMKIHFDSMENDIKAKDSHQTWKNFFIENTGNQKQSQISNSVSRTANVPCKAH